MSIKRKISLTFTLLVMVILILSNYFHYIHSKEQLLKANEREIKLITEEVTFQVENSKRGALYVENLVARELRTASIAALKSLPPRHEDVTNEQLVQLAKELNVSHISLFARAEDDIIGVKSSDPHEIGIGTKEWTYWYEAFQQLFELKPVTVEKGLVLPNYWSGPIEVASSNPEHIDKWGYYFDGSTNYIINPYLRDNDVLEYEEKFGPAIVMDRFTKNLKGILEITVFNPNSFGDNDTSITLNGNTFVRISEQPIWYGDYEYKNIYQDKKYIHNALDSGKTLKYSKELNGKDIEKTFIPVKGENEFVIGITFNYQVIQEQLNKDLREHVIFLVLFMTLVLIASSIYSRTITKPISIVIEQVNEIAKGNFGKRVSMNRKDEFGVLTENVNTLAESLKVYTDDLIESRKIIEFQAYHDPLTALPNRRFIMEKMGEIEKDVHNSKQNVSVIFLDVDRFKHVNDTLGHKAGDDLIIEIAKRVRDCVPKEGSVVARQGGDEFIILLENYTKEQSIELADAIVDKVKRPYLIGDNELYVSASCGISLYPIHCQNIETLITYSDMAMYDAKKQGGNKAVIYHENLNQQNKERAQVESRLRKAIEEDMLEVYYQPKMNARTNELTGVEALVRWNDAELGFVSPSLFIPIAEDTGLIQPLWEQIMKKSCAQVVAWNRERGTALTLSVNFSARQFQDSPNLVEKVNSILRTCELAPELFEIEITESILMYNTNDTSKTLKALQATGIKIAIDDFGTGYSSLSYLTTLPINKLKIDQAFIQCINQDYENSEIALAVINLARSLRLEVIAEGVEEEYQIQYLLENHCDQMQGFYFNKPIPADAFEEQYFPKTI